MKKYLLKMFMLFFLIIGLSNLHCADFKLSIEVPSTSSYEIKDIKVTVKIEHSPNHWVEFTKEYKNIGPRLQKWLGRGEKNDFTIKVLDTAKDVYIKIITTEASYVVHGVDPVLRAITTVTSRDPMTFKTDGFVKCPKSGATFVLEPVC